mmetsp:Transcript_12623/g.29867  ORF Transcript_12623/g.29867 Transcript_12623/m.29867 type:complete len:234 (-) Transcript_12623:132-833(-)
MGKAAAKPARCGRSRGLLHPSGRGRPTTVVVGPGLAAVRCPRCGVAHSVGGTPAFERRETGKLSRSSGLRNPATPSLGLEPGVLPGPGDRSGNPAVVRALPGQGKRSRSPSAGTVGTRAGPGTAGPRGSDRPVVEESEPGRGLPGRPAAFPAVGSERGFAGAHHRRRAGAVCGRRTSFSKQTSYPGATEAEFTKRVAPKNDGRLPPNAQLAKPTTGCIAKQFRDELGRGQRQS